MCVYNCYQEGGKVRGKSPEGKWGGIRSASRPRTGSAASPQECTSSRARPHARRERWRVTAVFRLDAVSGQTVRRYPEASIVLTNFADGTSRCKFFSKLARLALNIQGCPNPQRSPKR